MSKKILTEELVEQRLADKGFPLTHSEGMTYSKMLDKVCKYYDTKITDEWEDNLNFYIYPESTADGYEVFVATHDYRRPNICEDVYYYDSDLAGVLENALIEGGKIYIDDYEADYVHEAAECAYNYLYGRLIEEIENDLIKEGYEWEE